MGRGLILAQVVLLTVLASCLANSVVKKKIHSDGSKDFMIVKHVQRNQCTCTCTCVPDSPTTPEKSTTPNKFPEDFGKEEDKASSKETETTDQISEAGIKEEGTTPGSDETPKSDGGIETDDVKKENGDGKADTKDISTESEQTNKEVNQKDGSNTKSDEDHEMTEEIMSSTVSVIEAHITIEEERIEFTPASELEETTESSASTTIESNNGFNSTNVKDTEEGKTTPAATENITKAHEGAPEASTIAESEKTSESETTVASSSVLENVTTPQTEETSNKTLTTDGTAKNSNGTELVTEHPMKNGNSTTEGMKDLSAKKPTEDSANTEETDQPAASTVEPVGTDITQGNGTSISDPTEKPSETAATTDESAESVATTENKPDAAVESFTVTALNNLPEDNSTEIVKATNETSVTDAATALPKSSNQSTAESMVDDSAAVNNADSVDGTATADGDKDDKENDKAEAKETENDKEKATDTDVTSSLPDATTKEAAKEDSVPGNLENTTEPAAIFTGSTAVLETAENASNSTAESDTEVLLNSATEDTTTSNRTDSSNSTTTPSGEVTTESAGVETENLATTVIGNAVSTSEKEKEENTTEAVLTEATTAAAKPEAKLEATTEEPEGSNKNTGDDITPDTGIASTSGNATESVVASEGTTKAESQLNTTGIPLIDSENTEGATKSADNSETSKPSEATKNGQISTESATIVQKTSPEGQSTTTEPSDSTTGGSEEEGTSDEEYEDDEEDGTTTTEPETSSASIILSTSVSSETNSSGTPETNSSGTPETNSSGTPETNSSGTPETHSSGIPSTTNTTPSKEDGDVSTSSGTTEQNKEELTTTESPKSSDEKPESSDTSEKEQSITTTVSPDSTESEKATEKDEKTTSIPPEAEKNKPNEPENTTGDANVTEEVPKEANESGVKDSDDSANVNATEKALSEIPVSLVLTKEKVEEISKNSTSELKEESNPNGDEFIVENGPNVNATEQNPPEVEAETSKDTAQVKDSKSTSDTPKEESHKNAENGEGEMISSLETLKGKEAIALGIEIPQLELRTTKKITPQDSENKVAKFTETPSTQQKESEGSHEESKEQKHKAASGGKGGSFVVEKKKGAPPTTSSPALNDGNEKIRQGWRDALERLRQKLRAHREQSKENKQSGNDDADDKKDKLSDTSKGNEEEGDDGERHIYLVQVVKDAKQTQSAKPEVSNKDDSVKAGNETSSEPEKSKTELETKTEALVETKKEESEKPTEPTEAPKKGQEHDDSHESRVVIQKVETPVEKKEEIESAETSVKKDQKSTAESSPEVKKVVVLEKSPAKIEQKDTPELAFSVDEPSDDGIKQGMSFAVDRHPDEAVPSRSSNGRPVQMFSSWRTPPATDSRPINAKSLRQKMAKERDIAMLKQQEMSAFNREEGHRIREQQVRARFEAQEERLYELELNASTEEKEKQIHDARQRLEKARLLREEQLKIDRLREVSSPEEQQTLMERRQQISRQLDQLTKRERSTHQKIAHREIDQQTRARAVQTALMNALTNANGSVFGEAPDANALVKNFLINVTPKTSTQAPSTTLGPLPPATGGGLQLDKPQCDSIKKFARVFQMKKPVEWIRKNCAFAQQYFPKLSCEEIQDLFQSCIPRS